MKPILLKLCGWGPYKNEEIVDFAPMGRGGLFLITGPTGAGKTTIFDGITYALYGEVSGSVREKDSLRSDFAAREQSTYVHLDFVHGQKQYHVERSPRYEREKLRGEGRTVASESGLLVCEGQALAQGGAQVTQAVTELLGLDYQQFKQISMLAQGEFQRLLTASSKERTEIYRNIFQTEIYNRMTAALSERTRKLKDEIDGAKARMAELADGIRLESGEWRSLLEKKSRNYGKIIEAAETETGEQEERIRSLKKAEAEAEGKHQRLLKEIERQKARNQQIAQFLRQRERLAVMEENLAALKEEYKETRRMTEKIPAVKAEAETLRIGLERLEDKKRNLAAWRKKQGELVKKQREFERLLAAERERRRCYEERETEYRLAAAGILAAGLSEGSPCPVCGSLEHPKPAKLSGQAPDERELKALKKEYEEARSQAESAGIEAASLRGALKSMEQLLEDMDLSDGGETALAVLCRQLNEYDAAMKEKLRYAACWEERYRKQSLELESLKASREELKKSIKEPTEKEPADISALQEEAASAEREKKQLRSGQNQLLALTAGNRRSIEDLKRWKEQEEGLEAGYSDLRLMERAASGYNARGLVFEQYVLSVYLEEILNAANRRLRAMTGSRYELYRAPAPKDRRSRGGMDLEVLDQYTGKHRSVKSLSGGETFKASLALALGTSDVIQQYAGGIRVETLFVDEGFGALDEESLDQALDILTALSSGNRMIGIISHVEELRNRIDRQIVVEKENSGSRIKSGGLIG